jgi:hypothetical protein
MCGGVGLLMGLKRAKADRRRIEQYRSHLIRTCSTCAINDVIESANPNNPGSSPD